MSDWIQIGFTPLEWEVIRHRLDVPDAICDALCDGDDPMEQYHEDDVCAVAELLYRGDWTGANDINPSIVAAVLVDCIDGSTYGALNTQAWGEGEISPQKGSAIARACESASAKVSEAAGVECRVSSR